MDSFAQTDKKVQILQLYSTELGSDKVLQVTKAKLSQLVLFSNCPHTIFLSVWTIILIFSHTRCFSVSESSNVHYGASSSSFISVYSATVFGGLV